MSGEDWLTLADEDDEAPEEHAGGDAAQAQPGPLPVRFHMLRAAGRSPAHARLALSGAELEDETAAMERGTSTHAILFGTRKVVAYPGKQRRGKEWETFQALHRNAEILTARGYECASRMAEAVSRSKLAMAVLAGSREQRILWQQQGRACRTTPDVASYLEYVTELKTTACADPARFQWHALRMHYHAQLAWHQTGVVSAGLGNPHSAFIVAVESAAPYPVTVMRVTDRALEAGEKLCRLWFERLIGCEKTNEWPWPEAYAQTVVDLDIPDDEPELIFGSVEAA